MDALYQSSEEVQRRNSAGVFATPSDTAAPKDTSEITKVKRVLDKYIAKHKSTDTVRDMAKEANRTADAQLDLSAELVTILEKIKKELG